MNTLSIKFLNLAIVCLMIFSSCGTRNSKSGSSSSSSTSTSTGWKYNDYKNGGFEKIDAQEQETGPGLVLIEGGVFTMGRTEQDVMFDWNARATKVTVGSFYLDKTEVTNLHWLEYMYWMKRVYNKSFPHVFKKSLPDTLAWRKTLGYREKYVEYYLRHPSYRDYPVVGVTWLQANEFCKWRTDRVNESILQREGIINWHYAEPKGNNSDIGSANLSQKDYDKLVSTPQNMFSTENYLNGTYFIETGKPSTEKKNKGEIVGGYVLDKDNAKAPLDNNKREIPRDPYQLKNFDPIYADKDKGSLGKRAVKLEDGILLPNYRLPTEAEWEFAALGLIGNLDPESENINDRRIYPWDGHYVRQDEKGLTGSIQANFMRGRGDMMGVAGNLNDGGDITVRVDEYWPNDYGLYHMAGNVSEWVMDVYRPMSSESFEEFMPFRGNVYKTQLLVPNGLYDKYVKANENLYDVHGMKEFVNEFARVMYLANTKNVLDLNKKFSSNYGKPKTSKIDFSVKTDGDTIFLSVDKAQLIALDITKTKYPINWDLTNIVGCKVDMNSRKDADGDTIIKLITLSPSVYSVKLKLGTLESLDKEIDTKGPLVNSKMSKVKINARQEKEKYKYNSPSLNYISSKGFTKNDSIQFAVLDDIISILDTAIYLQNKGNETKASHYIEVALFGSYKTANPKILSLRDFRDKTAAADEDEGEGEFKGSVYLPSTDSEQIAVAVFGLGKNFGITDPDHYLSHRFNNYDQDPNITTWILTLRNGLTEFLTETKGKQRWRNVTVEENAGRLNYRKDDYRDQLDGDIESSIYYNNASKLDDINNGKRDQNQVMYQSDFETYDLEGNLISSNGNPKTLISNKSRVYKGGSWADRAYWLSAGNRRFLDEDKSSDMIGFRCAMDRFGSPSASRNGSRRK